MVLHLIFVLDKKNGFTMKKIMFATDYGPHAELHFRYAHRLAKNIDAEITLVHIYQAPSTILASNAGAALLLNKSKNDAEHWHHEWQKLKNFSSEITTNTYNEIPLKYIVSDGDVVENLCKIQEEIKFDLCIIGAKQDRLFFDLSQGITYDLIENLECPILAIPSDAYYLGFDNITYGTAIDFAEIHAIELLLEWSEIFNANLQILHIYKDKNRGEAVRKMVNLQKYVSKEFDNQDIDYHLSEGNIVERLASYVNEKNIDLLAIHHRKEGFWKRIKDGSVAKTLSRDIEIPLLILK